MKKIIRLCLLSFFVLQTNLFPQSPIVQQVINSVNIDSLIYFVKELSGEVPTIINGTSQTILSRHRDQPGNAFAETYIKQKLESYGLPVTIQNYSATGNNVLGTQVGTQYPNKKFIICAHYDDKPPGTIAPGADDNGASVATVIEAAKILSQYSFPLTIVYALWDEEEDTGWGGWYYAQQAAASGDSILGVFNMDAIGWDGNNDNKCAVLEIDRVHSVQMRSNIIEINNQYGINLNIEPLPPYFDSDQAFFWFKGFDAIALEQDAAGDMNPNYHTINDRVQYLNKPYYLKMSKLALGSFAFFALYLNFDIIHSRVPTVIPAQATNTNIFIYTSMQIGVGASAPRMYYRTKEYGGNYGDFNEITGTSTGGGNYSFNIPALPNGTFVQYYVAAQDENSTIVRTSPLGGSGFNPPGNIPPNTFYEFLAADLSVVWSDSANNLSNWTKTGYWDTTSIFYVSPPTSFTDSPNGTYPLSSALSCNTQFPASNGLKTYLEFDAQWAMEYGYYHTQVELFNGSYWIPLSGQYTFLAWYTPSAAWEPYYSGVQPTWVHEIIDISEYANLPFKFRFLSYAFDSNVFMDGFYVDNVRISTYRITDVEDTEQLPIEFSLSNSYPNPFNPTTTIKYQIPELSFITLKVYDVLGNEIETLVNHEKVAGTYEVTWFAKQLPSGVYFYQLRAGEFIQAKKMILLN